MDSISSHPAMQPGQQAGFGERLRNSKALLPTVAVLGVTTLALAAALVSGHISARDGVPEAQMALGPAPASQKAPAKQAAKPATPDATRVAASSCANCGVVESVVAVQRQGQVNGIGNSGIGVGAIGGAVVGGLLGNQIGGGSGKTAATVLGAAGGAYAGHAIEKNSKKVTVYQMRVRMNDGTVRTIEQGSSLAAGSRVVVEGNTARVMPVNS